jgi:hypothetical protein
MTAAWQPIETHDRSKTPILVGMIRDGVLIRVELAVFSVVGYYTRYGGTSCSWRTHWMPAPLPDTDCR